MGTIDPLAELLRSEREEIEKHKWIESEKAGRDIGWQQALEDWLQHHFAEWARHQRSQILEEALHAETTKAAAESSGLN